MDHAVAVTAEFDDPALATRVADSLAPEVGAIAGDRTSVALERDGDSITLLVEARDLPALRAGTNTWTRLLDVAERLAREDALGDPAFGDPADAATGASADPATEESTDAHDESPE